MIANENELKNLLLAGLAGDNDAYRSFLDQVSRLLRLFIGRRLFRNRQTEQDSEDIVQETLIAIHSKRNTYDGETPVTAWIYGIARYKLIDNLRKSKNSANLAELDETHLAFDDTSKIEARLIVRKAVSLLPENLRQPVVLMKLQGHSVSEIASKTGASEVAVRINVYRGLKAMRRKIGTNGNSDEDR
jgi:RNA polymerase sigma-70 factor (ECF subfamily)